MNRIVDHDIPARRPGLRQWVAAAAFLLIAAYLWVQYQAYGFAMLPLALAIACPLAHLLHHGPTRRDQGGGRH